MDLVYGEYVRFSQETLEINPTEYIRKRRANREQLNQLQEIDDVLAEVVYKVRTTQNFTGQDYRIIEALRKKVNEFSKQKSTRNSILLRFKIYHSISRILLQKQDFVNLEKYLEQTFEEFNKEGLFTRNKHDTKLQLLTYLANAQFKNKKFEQSLATAARLKTAMNEFGGLLHDKYLFFYYNILVIGYSEKNKDRAIEILNEAKDNPVIKKLPFYLVFIFLNLVVLNFDNGNYKNAIRNLVKLTMEPGFPGLDRILRMKIAVAELIIRFELQDIDTLERRLEQVKKEFADLFRTKDGRRQGEMTALISDMSKSTSVRRDKVLRKKIQKILNDTSGKGNDVIDYSNWLLGKIE
jgi:tetratricopeptide (TPR) repeat protein